MKTRSKKKIEKKKEKKRINNLRNPNDATFSSVAAAIPIEIESKIWQTARNAR